MFLKALLISGGLLASSIYSSAATDGLPGHVFNGRVDSLIVVDTVSPSMFIEGSLRYGIDTAAEPCDDFYTYVNGDWRSKAVLPNHNNARFKMAATFDYAFDRMLKRMDVLLDSARVEINNLTDPALRAVGTFYESCMSADTLENPKVIRSTPPPMMGRGPVDTVFQYVKDTTREEKCRNRVLYYLGDAAGQTYAQQLIASGSVTHMEEILSNIRREVIERIEHNSIMSASEKKYALERFSRLGLRVGIPAQMVDYSVLKLKPDDYEGNKKEILSFNNLQWAHTLGANTRELWKRSLLQPNASYNLFDHAIEVPPVMFSPPFFYHNGPEALNYAGIGYIIGHEIFHSIAPQIFDMESEEMKSELERFKVFNSSLGELDGWKADGKQSLNEDIADLGGAKAAYSAWRASQKLKNHNDMVEGYTQEQLYFIGIGRVWRAAWQGVPPKMPHAPNFARANGIAKQMPEFAHAFGCKAGNPMHMPKDSLSRIW